MTKRGVNMPFRTQERPKGLKEMIDVSAEVDREIVNQLKRLTTGNSLVDKHSGAFLSFIGSYVPKRAGLFKADEAYIAYPEEFGIEEAVMKIKEAGKSSCYFLVNSLGGDMTASYNIARYLREEFTNIISIVPHSAASGGALIALVGDKVLMSPMARLSDLGVRITRGNEEISALHLVKGKESLDSKSSDDLTFVDLRMIEDINLDTFNECTQILDAMKGFVTSILERGMFKLTPDKAKELAHKLIYEYPYHGYPITYNEAKKIGLNVYTPSDGPDYKSLWQTAREWLKIYVEKPAGTHFIRYWIPSS